MARIGRQIDHFQEIDLGSIRADFSPDRLFRYTLEMDYAANLLNGGRSRTMTVILKNPSSADEKRSDSTIRKVETFVWQRFTDVARLRILNIFAFRATDAVEVNVRLKELQLEEVTGPDNDRFFRSTLESTDYLICAWGGPSGIHADSYQERIAQVRTLIRMSTGCPVFMVCGAQETREPLHGLMWGYDYAIKPFEV